MESRKSLDYTHIFYRQLGFQFAIQSQDIAIHIVEQEHQSIKSCNHWYAYVLHGTTVVGGGIVNDNRGEQVVVLVGNLHIEGSDQRRIHLDHLEIASDIIHDRFIEGSR